MHGFTEKPLNASARSCRVALIGCGYWGPNLLRNFLKIEGCSVTTVVDLNLRRLQTIKRLYPAVHLTDDTGAAIGHPNVDAVVIATPIQTHFHLVRKSLLAGKHVLVTKPMAASTQESEALVALAIDVDRLLMVDHTFVYSGPVRKIRDLLQSGEVGEIYYYDSVRANLGIFQSDANVLWDLAPHDFSVIGYLHDAAPIRISAIGAQPLPCRGYNHEGLVYVTIVFDDGMLAHMHLSWLSPVKVRRTLIGGSKKMLVYDHLEPDNQIKVYDKGVEISDLEQRYQRLAEYRTGDMYAPKVEQTEALEIECRHFVGCCLGHERPLIDGIRGLAVVKLLEAAQKSLEAGGRMLDV